MRTPQQASIEAKEAREAWERGEEIKYTQILPSTIALPYNLGIPDFTSVCYKWRPKRKPTLKPWTFETCPLGVQVRYKGVAKNCALLLYKHEFGAAYGQAGSILCIPYLSFLEKMEWSPLNSNDWKPCGTLE